MFFLNIYTINQDMELSLAFYWFFPTNLSLPYRGHQLIGVNQTQEADDTRRTGFSKKKRNLAEQDMDHGYMTYILYFL